MKISSIILVGLLAVVSHSLMFVDNRSSSHDVPNNRIPYVTITQWPQRADVDLFAAYALHSIEGKSSRTPSNVFPVTLWIRGKDGFELMIPMTKDESAKLRTDLQSAEESHSVLFSP